MALGGGTFTTMNKILAGTYMNFVSAAKANANLSDRGYVSMPLELNWGADDVIFTVEQNDFLTNSMEIFGYPYDAPEMKGLRDLFLYAQTAYLYKLTSGGVKATNTYATAICCGTRGNDLKIVISVNVDRDDKFDVALFMGTTKLNSQTVGNASELVDDAWVVYKKDATLQVTAGTALAGGTNGTVTGESHSKYLALAESYSFNTMGVVTTDATTKTLYASYVKRMRENVGVKFQCVIYNKAADYEGVINVKNEITDDNWNEASLVYWVTGVEGACAVNKSCTNKKYDGEFTIDVNYKQSELEASVLAGEFTLHRVGDDIRILTDINSLVTETVEKGVDFKSNQTIRVIDQLGNDIAVLFNTKYIGQVPNDADGRTSLWADIVDLEQQLNDIRAIENFSEEDVVVSAGRTKKAVIVQNSITPVNAMEQLYMTVTVS